MATHDHHLATDLTFFLGSHRILEIGNVLYPAWSGVPASGHCKEDSCSGGASCVGLKVSHFCLCANGYYYNSSQCNRGKIFPGTITVTVSETSGLQDGHSAAYEQLHLEVTEFFKNAFAETDYGQTVINNVRISPSASSEFRANQDVVITVVNLFLETTKENKTSVSRAIDEAIKNSSVITKYAAQDLCDFYGCVKTEGEEDCNDGLLCKCKDGLERPNPQIALCVRTTEATSCPDGCNAEHHKQCLMRDGLTPECLCLPGYKQKDGGICQACAFGYGGVDCEDYFQLILVIVGIVAGLLILGMMIALILVRSKGKKNNIEEENLIKNDFQNLRLQETSGFSNPGAEGSIFPKIRTSYSRENQLQNPYVNQRGIPRPDY
ncbi:mucin-13 [Rousettus aegyptiacus]|uniref:mucin-13 n=1 Tax=Rousettus aegyptiacus TaxID=9407 RepID=UPI00168D4F16|nr:mucin-13 [Rousettus aegyptiacus]